MDASELKQKTVRGGVITLVAQAVRVCLGLTSTIVLARLLGPEEFGVIAMVTAITAFASLFRDLGLSSSTIQKASLTHEQLSTLYWVNVAAGALIGLVVAAAAPVVGWFYGRVELIPVTVWLATTFVINGFGTQQNALLTRQMRFGRIAVATICGSVVSLGVAVVLAVREYGYWALVWSSISGACATTVLLNALSGWRPGVPKRGSGIGSMLRFGAHITGFDFVNYFHRNLDNILIGRFWGADVLGLYNRAYSLMMFPITNLRTPINSVAFPGLSKLQGRPNEYRTYFRRLVSLVSFVSMPTVAFAFVVSESLIQILLGEKWLGAAPLFSILAISGFMQPVAGLRGLVLLSTGQSKRYLQWGIVNSVFMSIGFGVGVVWGSVGVAVAYAVVSYGVLYPSICFAFRDTPVKVPDFFEPLILPLLSSVVAALVTSWLPSALPSTGKLLSAITTFFVFAVVYGLTFLLLPGGKCELGRFFSLAGYLSRKPVENF